MPATNEITRPTGNVNAALVQRFADRTRELLDGPTLTGRTLEKAIWDILLETGREMLTAGLAKACWETACAANGGRPPNSLRLDGDYWLSQATTLGTVTVPLFAHRDSAGTHAPARDAVFPLHPHCRSSELLLEWETRLGAQLPFRRAQEELHFFTHGAVGLEDTTIARHIGIIGGLADRQFQFRSLEDFREILTKRATRDRKTGRPIVYISTDAHSLRRYVDDTWEAAWRNINGIRGKLVTMVVMYTLCCRSRPMRRPQPRSTRRGHGPSGLTHGEPRQHGPAARSVPVDPCVGIQRERNGLEAARPVPSPHSAWCGLRIGRETATAKERPHDARESVVGGWRRLRAAR